MVQKQFYNIEELSTILGKTVSAIHGHVARKQYDAVPPPIKLGRRLAWLVDVVNAWIKEKTIQAAAKLDNEQREGLVLPKKCGRPTKAEQIRSRGTK